MARIPRHLIDEIRLQTSLVDVVSRHVKLQQRGNSHVGLCPFHQEKSPSFHVVPHKHLYHCFGCGAAGDCFRFMMEIEGLSFVEAVRELATVAGITIEERELTQDEQRQLSERASRYDALEKATVFWESILLTRPEGAAAREYLKGRGITPSTAQAWRLGFAPDDWTATVDRLRREGFDEETLLATGIARKSPKTGRVYDAFRGRVIIPITDERGRVIAFGGRVLSGDGPKYINSSDGPLYQKSRVLFGLHHARPAIQRAGRALVVEGYFDVISLHQAGFGETIATCGTALTSDHLEALRRLTPTVVALFDSDEAGARAAERALPLFLAASIEPLRLDLPDAKDPDELIQSAGPEAMAKALDRCTSLLDWLVERKIAHAGGRAASEAIIDEVVSLLALTEGVDILGRAAARLKIPVPVLDARVQLARRAVSTPQTATKPALDPDRWKPAREQVHVLWLLIHRQHEVARLATLLNLGQWPELGIARTYAQALIGGETIAELTDRLDDEGTRRILARIAARDELYTPAQAELGLAHIAQGYLGDRLDTQIHALSDRIQAAVATHDWTTQQQATRLQLDLRRQKKDLAQHLSANDVVLWTSKAREILDLVPPQALPPTLS